MIEINVRDDKHYSLNPPIYFKMMIDPTRILSVKPYDFLDYKAFMIRNAHNPYAVTNVKPLPEEILETGCEIFTKDDKYIYVTDSYQALKELINPSIPRRSEDTQIAP